MSTVLTSPADMKDIWNEVAALLGTRDAAEGADSAYYDAFSQLARFRTACNDPNLDRLTKENTQLREENELLVLRLNLQTLRLEANGERIRELSSTVKAQEGKLARSQQKVAQLTTELAEKNRLFEVFNDEHLIMQIQQNVLSDKVAALERELAQR